MNNILILIGRITKDLELKVTPSNRSVLDVSLAITNGKEDTTFITVTAFGKTAELINNYCSKGDLISVQAIVKNHNWTDKNGHPHYDYSFIVDKVRFLQKSQKENNDSKSVNQEVAIDENFLE